MKKTSVLLSLALVFAVLASMFAIGGFTAAADPAATTWDYEHTMAEKYDAWDLSEPPFSSISVVAVERITG